MLLGRALATHKQEHQLLPKLLALPILSSDALSSVSYATEEMMLVLALAGAGALGAMLPIGAAIAILLAIVVTSYRQTVRAYPRGGGSYIDDPARSGEKGTTFRPPPYPLLTTATTSAVRRSA